MNKNLIFTQDRFEGSDFMIKKIAWNTFKKTGNVDTFLEFKQIQNIEQEITQKVEQNNGNNQNEGDNNIGEQFRGL